MNLDVSPDGESLVFDLLGDIYSLPIKGGEAVALTSGRAWDQAPRFSSDGESIYLVSDRIGFKGIWRLTLSDGRLEQVTARNDIEIRGTPNWSQADGRLLVGVADVASGTNADVVLNLVNAANGTMSAIDSPIGPSYDWGAQRFLRDIRFKFSGVQTADSQVYFSERRMRDRVAKLYHFEPSTQTATQLTPKNAEYSEFKPQLSHDGRTLAYFRQYNNRLTQIRVLDLATGQDREVIELQDAEDASYVVLDDARPNYSFTADDRALVFWHDGQIKRVGLADGVVDIVPFTVRVEREVAERVRAVHGSFIENTSARIIRWPSLSSDSRKLAFAAIGHVYIKDLDTGVIQRLTASDEFEYMPAISPDGKFVAYVSIALNDKEDTVARLMIADIRAKTQRELLRHPNETYFLPQWSPDGSMIALIREVRGEIGPQGSFGWTTITDPRFREVAAAPVSTDLSSLNIFARSVGFDHTGENLLFTYPRSVPPDPTSAATVLKSETVLESATLTGSFRSVLAVGSAEVGGISPAPNLDKLALTRADGSVWIVPFASDNEPVATSTLGANARRVTNGGYYVTWNQSDKLTFGFGKHVYLFSTDSLDTETLPIEVEYPRFWQHRPVAFVGARIITMSSRRGAGDIFEQGTLLLVGRRIAAVGPMTSVPIPSEFIVIDATGKTLMPGLLDTHYHRIGGDLASSAFQMPNSRFSDYSAMAFGVTTAWEPGGSRNDGVPATADLQTAGRIIGPRWSYAGQVVAGLPHDSLASNADTISTVTQRHSLGVDVIKEYNVPTREQRQQLVDAASKKGLGLVSHIESFDGMMTRVVDGYTGGDHPYIPVPFFKDVRELLRQTGYVWTPNIVITTGTVRSDGRQNSFFCRAFFDWKKRQGPQNRAANPGCLYSKPNETLPFEVSRSGRVARQAALAADAGVHVGVSAHGMPGANLHREMWSLWKGGMPIEDVLQATTIGNAEKLGLQREVGSLAVGKMSDFLVLDENPLDNILNTLSIRYTIQGGIIYDAETAERITPRELQRRLAAEEAANDDDATIVRTGTDN